MTVCIAVCLPDSVFLMTDGRTTNHRTGKIISDDTEKMKMIGSNFIISHLGVDPPLKDTLARLDRDYIKSATTPNAIKQHISNAFFYGLAPFEFAIPQSNLTREEIERLRFALIYIGIFPHNSRPYIGGKIWTSTGPGNELLVTNPPRTQRIALGGEDVRTQQIFDEKMKEIIPSNGEVTISHCVKAGKHTIRKVQQDHSSVGGTIRYYTIDRHQRVKYQQV